MLQTMKTFDKCGNFQMWKNNKIWTHAREALSVCIPINEPSREAALEFKTGFISVLMSCYRNAFRTETIGSVSVISQRRTGVDPGSCWFLAWTCCKVPGVPTVEPGKRCLKNKEWEFLIGTVICKNTWHSHHVYDEHMHDSLILWFTLCIIRLLIGIGVHLHPVKTKSKTPRLKNLIEKEISNNLF